LEILWEIPLFIGKFSCLQKTFRWNDTWMLVKTYLNFNFFLQYRGLNSGLLVCETTWTTYLEPRLTWILCWCCQFQHLLNGGISSYQEIQGTCVEELGRALGRWKAIRIFSYSKNTDLHFGWNKKANGAKCYCMWIFAFEREQILRTGFLYFR
jgi:hypothetical protein